MLVFVEGGKPEKNPRSKDEKQQQTQPTYGINAGNRTRAHTGEWRVLSPLHHPCSREWLHNYFIRVNATRRHCRRDIYESQYFSESFSAWHTTFIAVKMAFQISLQVTVYRQKWAHFVQNPPYWEHVTHWGIQKKKKQKNTISSSQTWIFFVLYVPVRSLLSSMVDFVPCDR